MQPPPGNQELGSFHSSRDIPRDEFPKDPCEHPITLSDDKCYGMRDLSIDNLTHSVAVRYDQAIPEGSAETPDHFIGKFDMGNAPVRIGMDPPLTEGSTSDPAEMADPQHAHTRAMTNGSPLSESMNLPNATRSSSNDNNVEYMEAKGHSRSIPLYLDLTPGDLVLSRIDGRRGRKRIGKQWDNQSWNLVRQQKSDASTSVFMAPHGEAKIPHCSHLLSYETVDSTAPLTTVSSLTWDVRLTLPPQCHFLSF